MKRFKITLMMMFFSVLAFSQSELERDILIAKQQLTVNGYDITGISNDSILTIADSLKLMTQYAVKKYVLANAGGGSNPNYLTTNTGVQGDYITINKGSGGSISVRNKVDFTPVDLLTDIRNDDVFLINETFGDYNDFEYPTEWIYDTIPISYNGERYYSVLEDLPTFRKKYMVTGTGKTYYVDYFFGDDTNDGLSRNNSLKTLSAALLKPDRKTIFLESGWYLNQDGFNVPVLSDVNIIGSTIGDVVVGSAKVVSFVVDGTYDNVYTVVDATIKGVASAKVNDLDGIPVPYEKVSSVSECSKTPFSVYFGTSDSVYVNHSFTPVSNIDLYMITNSFYSRVIGNENPTAVTVYLENLLFLGGGLFEANETGNKLFNYNCKFSHMYNLSYDGIFAVQSIDTTISVFPVCKYGSTDGLNYHNVGAITTRPFSVEIHPNVSEVSINGVGTSDQAKTLHEDCVGITIGGSLKGYNEAIFDANESWSINIGNTIYGNMVDEAVGISGSSVQKIWLINPKLGGSNTLSVGGANGQFFINGIDYKNVNLTGTGFEIY